MTKTIDIVADSLPLGFSGYALNVSLDNTSVGEILGVNYPSWAILNSTTALPGDSVTISVVDLDKQVQNGTTNVTLATLTIRGEVAGTCNILLANVHIDDDNGSSVQTTLTNGSFSVYTLLSADFNANVTVGTAGPLSPFIVGFTDLSSGSPGPSSWSWDFDDGSTSTVQDPVHAYAAPGNYTVTLTAANQYTNDAKVIIGYIRVKPYVEAFPGYTGLPTDPDGDGYFEDVNGNGAVDFDDVVAYYQHMDWMESNGMVGISPYDYNNNGRIDYDDVVTLYYKLLGMI